MLFAAISSTFAQELTVKSFKLVSSDLTAQTQPRKDTNNFNCAVVKVLFVGDIIDFDGNIVKPVVKYTNETWVYMPQRSRQLKITTKDYLPLMVTFEDYGVDKLESNRTYVLTLLGNNKIDERLIALLSSNQQFAQPPVKTVSINVKDGINIEMVKVEAGTFTMGATSELNKHELTRDDKIRMFFGITPEKKDSCRNVGKPAHQVTLTNDYYIGKYEVTQALWKAVMGNNPSNFKGDNLPVEQVSWNDCQEFLNKLNSITGKTFRLPTEAEWEYAARGGNKSRGYQYSGSNNLSDVAWYGDNSGSKTHPVGSKQANELGIYDMSGNVWEWCQDRFGSYSSSPQNNPTGANGFNRVYRGGCWSDNVWYCYSSYRLGSSSNSSSIALGLRLVLSE